MALWRKSPKHQDSQDAEAKLAEILTSLQKDESNPDLWFEAAKGYLEIGNLEQALKCAESCLGLDSTRGDAKLLMDDVKSMMDAQQAAAEGSEAEEKTVKEETVEVIRPQQEVAPASESEADSEPEPEGSEATPRGGIAWIPEEERPRFRDEKEALEELQRELNPSSTTTCPTCNTLLEVEAEYCYGCGQEVKEKLETLDQRMDLARTRLKTDEDDPDALFTLAAYRAVSGDHQEAMEALHKLSRIDNKYPGLWWLKARVFELLGMRDAAEAAIRKALEAGTQIVESS